MRRVPLLIFALVVAAGCAVGNDDPAELASTPSTTGRGRPAVVMTSTTTTSTVLGAPGISPTTAPSTAASTSTTAPLRTAGHVADAAGDAGPAAPPYADARAVQVSSRSDQLVVRVTFDGAVPARLAEGEVEGVGVDFFTTGSTRQSDWQVFADGEPDGWYGYLDGPDGPETLPGTLTIDGDALVFELAWSAIGDPSLGTFSAFIDWARDSTLLDTVTEDHAPDTGRTQFQRAR